MKKKHVSLSPRSAAIFFASEQKEIHVSIISISPQKSKFILPVVGVSYSGYDDSFRRETSFKPY